MQMAKQQEKGDWGATAGRRAEDEKGFPHRKALCRRANRRERLKGLNAHNDPANTTDLYLLELS